MNIKNIPLHLILCLCIIFVSNNTYSQTKQEKSDLRKELNNMFAKINRQSVPTGLLRDYAEEYEDLDCFTGCAPLTEQNIVDKKTYGYLLSTIKSADLIGTISNDIDNYFNQKNRNDGNSSISLSVALYKYSQIRENALKDGLILYKNKQVYNTNKNPYQQAYFFACSPCVETTTESSINIKLSKENLLTNVCIKRLEINIGNTFHEIGLSQTVRACLKQGENEIVIKAVLDNGQVLLSHTFITKIENTHDEQSRVLGLEPIYNYPSGSKTIIGEDYRGLSTKAEVTWCLASGHSTIEKPFIVVEGFDPRSKSNPKGLWRYESIIAKEKFFQTLRLYKGYDIVYVDWENPCEYIQANSYALISVIRWINEQKAKVNSKEKNTILGHSMGGLIARYALKTMENKGIMHQTQAYISYDAPHLGAHIPLGLLYGYKAVREWCADKDFIKPLKINIGGVDYSVDELIQIGNSLAYSNAAAQMLVDYVNPEGNLDNREYLLWQKELTELGFPKGDDGHGLNSFAVANGSYKKPIIPDHYLTIDGNAGVRLFDIFVPVTNSAIYGLSLNDITAALVSLIPGKTKVDAEIRVSPAKKVGDEITHINIKIKKKFLWIGPTITHTNLSFDRYYPNMPLYDTYPSSKYDIKSLMGDIDGNLGDKLNISYKLLQRELYIRAAGIPFVPTSSALAMGTGLSHNPDLYTSEPQEIVSAFGKNYFIHNESQEHAIISDDAEKWIKSRLSTSIVGPVNGYTNAKYTLSNTFGPIDWKTSNSEIATINSNGILTIKGKGICYIEAYHNGNKYSMAIAVGKPRFIIQGTYKPGGYYIKTECIDEEFKKLQELVSDAFKFKWGIKYGNNSIEWLKNNVQEILFKQNTDNEHCICFLEVLNNQEERISLQNMEIGSQNIYDIENSVFYIDKNGILYDGLKNKYDFDYACIYFSRKDNLSPKYNDSLWGAVTALSVDPGGKATEVAIDEESIPLKDMFSKEAIDYMKLNSDENQEYVYTIVLLNYENKSLQYIPIRIIYKSDITK